MFRLASVICLLAASVASAQESDVPGVESLTGVGIPESKPDEPLPPAPQSMPGVVIDVTDADGNKYPMVVVQALTLAGHPTSVSYTVAVQVPEELTDADGVTRTVKRTVFETREKTVMRSTAEERARFLVSVPATAMCFGISGGVTDFRDISKDGTHVLVAGSAGQARVVAEGLRRLDRAQLALTGLRPQLPAYVIALRAGDIADDEQAGPIDEVLGESPPFKGNAKFFGDLSLQKEQNPKNAPSTSTLNQLLQAATPYRGTMKFFGDLSLREDALGGNASQPADPQKVLLEARQHFSANRYKEAERLLTLLIGSKSTEPLAHYLRGYIRYNRGDLVGANRDFKNGAAAEAPRGYSNSIGAALEFVQGPGRIALEKHRRALPL